MPPVREFTINPDTTACDLALINEIYKKVTAFVLSFTQ